MTNELKPCPKCGGHNLTTFIGGGRASWGIWESASFAVECECGTQFYVEVDVDTEMDSRPDDEIREYTYQKGIKAWNARSERTCRNVYDEEIGACFNGFKCSECGETVSDCEGYRVNGTWNYCPNCGAEVVSE